MIVFSIILMVPVQGIAAEKSTEIEILKDNKKTTTIKTHRASDLHMSDLIKIIDFSSNNENVNFNTLKDSGIKGVMLRIGSSSLEPDDTSISLDTKFESYYQAASDAGLTIGVYFFSQALSENEAKEQAAWVNDNLISKEITLPVAFDYEYSNGIVEGINNVIKQVKHAACGYKRFNHLKARVMLIKGLYNPIKQN